MNVGAIDIGTNSVRLLVTDAQGTEITRQMNITRLGQGVDDHQRLAPEAIERTTAVLARYRAEMERHQVQRVRATATSAARDAHNRDEFFEAAERALGTRPELLPGEQEAALSFAGGTAGLDPALAPFLIVDIGGGSTEFVLGEHKPEALISTDMGCVRMTERCLHSDPPTRQELAACERDVSAILETVRSKVPVERTKTLVGVAGTVTTLACMAKKLTRYDPSQTHGTTLSRDTIETLFAKLASADVATRRGMLLEPQRAEVIVGGVAVLVQILRDFDIQEVRVSESDILDGLAASLRG